MEEIKISVIVPVYGVEKYISRCARSLLGQTMTDGVEFIFIDDATPDRSIELLSGIIGEYPGVAPQVKLLSHSRNRGLAAARQTGLDAARGEYVLQLDSDDYFEPDMLEVMYRAAVANNSDVVVADFFYSYHEGDEYQKCYVADSKEVLLNNIIATWRPEKKTAYAYVWNKLTRRSLFTEHNIRSFEGINVGEDLIATIRTLYYASVVTKVDRAFAHYNKHNIGSYTHDVSVTSTRQRMRATDVVADFLSPKSPAYNQTLNERRFRKLLIAIVNCNREDIQECISMCPGLYSDYEKLKHLVPPYWRLPYKYALQGKTGRFVFLRNLILPIRKLYRFLRAGVHPKVQSVNEFQ
ncbi:MAG: glycosyltransferase family 2 protein [Bacteroides sp.]|nr:glycosyltransferase family 2 protein [Bacteroides sp.]